MHRYLELITDKTTMPSKKRDISIRCREFCMQLTTEAADEIDKLRERCEAYKGQVAAGAIVIEAAKKTLRDNAGLADGENCTLIDLKRAIDRIST